MEKNNLLDKITKSRNTSEDNNIKEEYIKLIIFTVQKETYAIDASSILEILEGELIFPLPFVPSYIRGLINKEGDPYTVFDLNMLFNQDRLDSSCYLILNIDNDQVAFMISDVIDIKHIQLNTIYEISGDMNTNYFRKYIKDKDSKVFILDINSISNKLQSDLNNE